MMTNEDHLQELKKALTQSLESVLRAEEMLKKGGPFKVETIEKFLSKLEEDIQVIKEQLMGVTVARPGRK
jgi:hypothetical protein